MTVKRRLNRYKLKCVERAVGLTGQEEEELEMEMEEGDDKRS